jgi:alpha-glucosidase
VPRGKYLFYKYTRGSWASVEKYPACVEAENRYELGKAHPKKVDTVWAWADMCP